MRIPTVEFSCNDVASLGLDGLMSHYGRKNEFVGVGCHKGERRSRTAASLLVAHGYPVANDLRCCPSVNYGDILEGNFVVSDTGLSVPGKTITNFRHLLVFTDDCEEERLGIRDIRKILDVEAIGVLTLIIVGHIRDEDTLLAMQ